MNVLITGANRGIGLSFVEHYLNLGAVVWACYRNDNYALQSLACDHLHLVKWDVTEPQPQLGILPSHLDILINNAGIYGPTKQAGQSLETVNAGTMMEVFKVDCIGPLQVVQALRPALAAAKGRIANVSSKMGSSNDNDSGGCYAYRAAKAALIITSKSMAIDLAGENIKVISLHPGWVSTDMTNHGGEIDTTTSVTGMCKVIDSIDNYPLGAFVGYDQKIIPF